MNLQSLSKPVSELDFASRPNRALHENRRGDFSFLMASLSERVETQSQFFLAGSKSVSGTLTESELKQELGVRAEHKLSADQDSYQEAVLFATSFQHYGLVELKLMEYLKRDTLSQFNDTKKVEEHVLGNISFHSLYRINQSENDKVQFEQDATKLLDILDAVRT